MSHGWSKLMYTLFCINAVLTHDVMCINVSPYYYGCWLLNCVLITRLVITLFISAMGQVSIISKKYSKFTPQESLQIHLSPFKINCSRKIIWPGFCYLCHNVTTGSLNTLRHWDFVLFLKMFSAPSKWFLWFYLSGWEFQEHCHRSIATGGGQHWRHAVILSHMCTYSMWITSLIQPSARLLDHPCISC